MTAVAPSPFYFLCRRCEAKWFAAIARIRCPRCGKRCRSDVQASPPWLRACAGTIERARAEGLVEIEHLPGQRDTLPRNAN